MHSPSDTTYHPNWNRVWTVSDSSPGPTSRLPSSWAFPLSARWKQPARNVRPRMHSRRCARGSNTRSPRTPVLHAKLAVSLSHSSSFGGYDPKASGLISTLRSALQAAFGPISDLTAGVAATTQRGNAPAVIEARNRSSIRSRDAANLMWGSAGPCFRLRAAIHIDRIPPLAPRALRYLDGHATR